MQVSYPNTAFFDTDEAPKIADLKPHREFFTGESKEALTSKMDARKKELEAQGHTGFARVKMGRNASCPCGSGKKFKHCCLAIAK